MPHASAERWVILWALPTTVDDYRRGRAMGDDAFCAPWPTKKSFEKYFVRPSRAALRQIAKAGVRVVERATLARIEEELRCGPEAVTIFAHWTSRSEVELYDGLHPWRDVAACIPTSWRGLLDLCVCHPDEMVHGVKKTHACTVKRVHDERVYAPIWLALYRVVATTMMVRKRSFLDSLVESCEKVL